MISLYHKLKRDSLVFIFISVASIDLIYHRFLWTWTDFKIEMSDSGKDFEVLFRKYSSVLGCYI